MQYDIRRFDIYRKIPKDLTEPTYTGACISIISCLFMTFLFLSELASFLTVEITSEMYVADLANSDERIPVRLDISLTSINCRYIGLDIQDEMGRHEVGAVENVEKTPINGEDGCRFRARFKINKVPGNFHISTHSSRDQPDSVDMGHLIHEVIFGDKVDQNLIRLAAFNPLANCNHSKALNSFDYILKVVPTLVEDIGEHTLLNPYQYTYAFREYPPHHGHSAVWFRYDLSPITVKYVEKRKPFYSFLTTICAIIGGTFTVAGIIDSLILSATGIFKKAQINKLN